MTETKVLLAGVDTFILNVRYPEDPERDDEQKQAEQKVRDAHLASLLDPLHQWAEVAKAENEPKETPWYHADKKLLVYPNGTPTHRYLLKNGLIDLLLGPQLKNGAMARVRFSSTYLWRHGVDAALMETHMFLSSFFQEIVDLQPAEVHVCVDVVRFPIPHHYERFFVTRAAKSRPIKESHLDKPIYRHHRLETLQFSGHGNPVSITIYDKIAEIEQQSKKKRWFFDLWKAHGWDGKRPTKSKKKDQYGLPIYDTSAIVWRIEARIKREALHEMKIEEAYQAIDLVPSLWAYCVGQPGSKDGWLRMVTPNRQDTNRGRWATAPQWETIREAFLTNWRDGVDIEALQRDWEGQINLDQAEKAIAGYTTTYAAWLRDELGRDDDVSVVLHRLYGRMLDLWEKRGVDFQTLRKMKEYLYHIS